MNFDLRVSDDDDQLEIKVNYYRNICQHFT